MKAERLREMQPATYWTPERIALFAELRNRRAPLARFRKEFGCGSMDAVRKVTSHLRSRGVKFAEQREREMPRVRRNRPTYLSGDEFVIPTMENHAVQPATVYDGKGRVIGRMDPVTRVTSKAHA